MKQLMSHSKFNLLTPLFVQIVPEAKGLSEHIGEFRYCLFSRPKPPISFF